MKDFIFKSGITDSQIDELIYFANNDPQVLAYTHDKDHRGSREAYNLWLKKNPIIYTLSNKTGNLCGFIWFRENIKVPGFNTCFGIRLYAEARGKGLSYDFMKQAFDDLKPQKVWLEVSVDNIPAVSLYKKFGFEQITKPDSDNKIIMTLSR